ncbi:hypothetical protein BCV70DRAFT_84421 [Testicularia cyperi]|uniref:Uncharacterized protein n=1 Tax=Testicularia cyperi TaxID=1882483 RepID=A0A317XSM3_9BASI|nr:hypothetical protein BCV70DRAFT_84421 [Testicularia cyperi]
MHEEPIDRSRDPWIERKRRFDQEEAIRREELLEARYRSSQELPNRLSPSSAPANRQDPRYAGHPSSSVAGSSRNGASPRSHLPPISNLPPPGLSANDESTMRDDPALNALKRRRLAEGSLDRDERRRDDLGPSGRSPPFRRGELAPLSSHGSGQRYLDERDAYPDDGRSPSNGQMPLRSNGRLSPLDRPLPARSPGAGPGHLPPMQEMHRPSVLSASSSAGYDDNFEHSSSMPGLARRRGDAAQAKASRLHIDTGSSSAFDAAVMSKGQAVAKSAPPQKLSFGQDGREPPLPFDQAPRDGPRYAPPGPSGLLSASIRPEQRAVSGSRLAEHPDSFRKDDRDEELRMREPRMPEVPHTANPLARHTPVSRMPPGYVPQTATLPSPAYHTTQFARGANAGGPRTAYNPPPTARLPDHLRSPPSSKAHFLSLFSDFYDSLYDSRTLKATLEDQIKRSNTLLQTLQSSRRVLEETVDRRVREERTAWEGRVRGLEARVRELEAKTGSPAQEEQVAARTGPSATALDTAAPTNAAVASVGSSSTQNQKDDEDSIRADDRITDAAVASKSTAEMSNGEMKAMDEDDEGDELKED